jgi:hypothetical protein
MNLIIFFTIKSKENKKNQILIQNYYYYIKNKQ